MLDEVSLELAAGELVGLVGANGAGKTTLVRLLAGVLAPSAGAVELEGRPVRRQSARAIARTIATVPQLTELSFDLTSLEYTLLGRYPHLGRFELEGRRDREIADRALELAGVSHMASRVVPTLSGGERQCVYLARGLAQEPRVLLVDEPTANLDLANQLRVMELLQRLARDEGFAVLAALHDLGLVARYATRLVMLRQGQVVAAGTPDEVLTSENIERTFGVHASVTWDPAGVPSLVVLGAREASEAHPHREVEETSPQPQPHPEPPRNPRRRGEGVDRSPLSLGDALDAPLEDLSDEGRAAKRREQEAARQHPERRAQGLVIVNTGDGKGKTTAALGLLLRGWGRNLRVVMFQFIKAATANFGENRAAERLGIEMIPLGAGFTWVSKDIQKDRTLAANGWRQARARLLAGTDDVVVLDELTYLMKFDWVGVEEVIETLRQRPPMQHVVITGRDAPAELIDYADLVTEMREVKHPYKSGIRAQPGVEF